MIWIVLSSIVLCVGCVHAGQCEPDHGFLKSCPRASDPPTLSKCCKHLYMPICCEEREHVVCIKGPRGRRNGTNIFPEIDEAAINCPGPGQADDMRDCLYGAKQPMMMCGLVESDDTDKVLEASGIIGGVLGLLLLVGIIITIICCLVRIFLT